MAKPLVTDELWALIEPLLPRRRRRRSRGGRPPLDDRKALAGIVFVLRTGIPWEHLPAEMGCGSGMTCWRRLRDWHQAGVWRELHRLLLARLRRADKIDWSRALVDSSSVRAVFGGRRPARARWTGGKRAPSTTCSPTRAARRCPRG
jgi:transposase